MYCYGWKAPGWLRKHAPGRGSRTDARNRGGRLAGDSNYPPGGGSGRDEQEYSGDTPAPQGGTYETVNLFGRRTGHRVTVREGETLPLLPRGFGWVLVAGGGG